MEPFKVNYKPETIAAISTPPGSGGIAVIRVSGPDAIQIVDKAWRGKKLSEIDSHGLTFGKYISVDGNILDEGLAAIFRAPNSFTGEDTVELNIHGSTWLQQEIIKDLLKRGVVLAQPGEFTQRAFLNGKIDLAQAEGIADLISASSKAAHTLAIRQTKGDFSIEFNRLRDNLIEFASLLELELDFSEEDVEFADRSNLLKLCENIIKKLTDLSDTYHKGKVFKNGIPVVIAGMPNVGKSSLLNLLLKDNKAIVTDIPGTTRDLIEDTVELEGLLFRFTDTAGLRVTEDKVEQIGVQLAKKAMQKASIIIWIFDKTQDIGQQILEFENWRKNNKDVTIIPVINKIDLFEKETDTVQKFEILQIEGPDFSERKDKNENPRIEEIQAISTKNGKGIQRLIEKLINTAKEGTDLESEILLTNLRHYEAINSAIQSLKAVKDGLNQCLPTDLVAQDLREAIAHLSSITGTITTDHLLHSIFSRFCIGK